MSIYRNLYSDSRKREIALIEAAAGMATAAASMLKAEQEGSTMMYEINRDILRREVTEYFAGPGKNSIFAERWADDNRAMFAEDI